MDDDGNLNEDADVGEEVLIHQPRSFAENESNMLVDKRKKIK